MSLKPSTQRLPGTASAALVAKGKTGDSLAAERFLVRLSFGQPIFGDRHDWAFVCDGQQAEDLAQALMARKPVRLAFPENTVIVDATQIALADFQPQNAAK
ncbi:MAG: hypothetical protein FJZ00_08190 [Candidatus Sericytochromatia bacterium]|uniref:Uncharacterized protein n=1 Tax=Candidatus Tanganyikabacteria bacterium TaxID=2961651 RepID=A0A938BNE5_9BACT|nr:hypothetical protein [Candidatus Tanganyikabacteria bacterium]